mgnify:CR=1 FL=1
MRSFDKEIKAMVFCRDSPRHVYFANTIGKHVQVDSLVVQLSPPFWNRFRKLKTIKRKINELWKYFRKNILGVTKKEKEYFFGKKDCSFHNKEIINYCHNINEGAVVDLVREKSPDLILTFGCGILKNNIFFDLPKFGIINLHSGITPKYRGVDNVYWCMHNKDMNNIGLTVHFVNKEIDMGEIISQIKISHDLKTDNEISLFNRVIRRGIEEFVEVLKKIKKGEKVKSAKIINRGRLYQEKDRTILSDIRTFINMREVKKEHKSRKYGRQQTF